MTRAAATLAVLLCGCVAQHEFERATDVTRKQIDDADKREDVRLDALEIAKSQLDAEISTIKGVGGVAAAAVTIALGFIGLRKNGTKGN